MEILGRDPWQYRNWFIRKLRSPLPADSPLIQLFNAEMYKCTPGRLAKLSEYDDCIEEMQAAHAIILTQPWLRESPLLFFFLLLIRSK